MPRLYEVLFWTDKVRGETSRVKIEANSEEEAKRKFREGNNRGKAIAGVGPAGRAAKTRGR